MGKVVVPNNNDNAVEVTNLSVKFGDFTAVDHISFSVKKGEIFGFLGANGAGKTTTIRVLCGLLIPTEGTARVAGYNVGDGLQEVKTKVGYMSQRFTLYQDLSVAENLAFAAALRKLSKAELEQRTQKLFDFIGFDLPVDTMVKDLAGGLKQEVSLTAAMLHDPEVVFLDEPTAGVTPSARARFWALIRQLSEQGKTIFVTTHYMDEAEQCGRIALMRSGQIIALDTPEGLKNTAFPHLLFELEPLVSAGTDRKWLELLKKEKGVSDVTAYGLRYHASVKDEKDWARISSGLKTFAKIRAIKPSLEDVFIHMVEGTGR